jgi:hypothetical protein
MSFILLNRFNQAKKERLKISNQRMTGNAVTFPFRKENKKTIQRRDHTLLHREVTIEHEPHYKQGFTRHYT